MKIFILIISCLCFACNTTNNLIFKPNYILGPAVIIYKTKADYSKNIPVTLSADKSQIISYPDPKDIKIDNKLALPTNLKKGYLMDHRGINADVAFLKLTYEEYSELKEPPSTKEMYDMIIDKNPLDELCNCGNKNAFTDTKKQVNQLIKSNKLRSVCKVIK